MSKRQEKKLRTSAIYKVVKSGQAEGLIPVGGKVQYESSNGWRTGTVTEHVIREAQSDNPILEYVINIGKQDGKPRCLIFRKATNCKPVDNASGNSEPEA